jgi:hypothetical protein
MRSLKWRELTVIGVMRMGIFDGSDVRGLSLQTDSLQQ